MTLTGAEDFVGEVIVLTLEYIVFRADYLLIVLECSHRVSKS